MKVFHERKGIREERQEGEEPSSDKGVMWKRLDE